MVAVRHVPSLPVLQYLDIDPNIRPAVFEATRSYWAMNGVTVVENEPTPEERRKGVVSINEVRLKAPFHCSRPLRMFIDHFQTLDISPEEFIATLQHLVAWSYMDTPPFSSESTISRKVGRSQRSVRRYQASMESKGYLKKTARYDRSRRGRRRTSNSHDYSGLLACLVALDDRAKTDNIQSHRKVEAQLRVITPDTHVRGARTPVSKKGPVSGSPMSGDLKDIFLREVDDKRYLSSAEPDGGNAPNPTGWTQEGDPSPLTSERVTENKSESEVRGVQGQLPFVQVVDTTIPEKLKRLNEVIDQTKVRGASVRAAKQAKAVGVATKRRETREKTWDEREALLEEKLERIQEEGRGEKAKRHATLTFFKPFLAHQMSRFPDAPFPKDWSGAMVGQLGQLIKMWGVSGTRQLIDHVFTHWRRLSRIVKNPGAAPSLGVISGYSQTFMDDMAANAKTPAPQEAIRPVSDEIDPILREMQKRSCQAKSST